MSDQPDSKQQPDPVAVARGRVGGLTAARNLTAAQRSERAQAGGRARRVAAAERRIRELVARAPELTDRQRADLAVLLLAPQAASAGDAA